MICHYYSDRCIIEPNSFFHFHICESVQTVTCTWDMRDHLNWETAQEKQGCFTAFIIPNLFFFFFGLQIVALWL
jgi:hypothetical protein